MSKATAEHAEAKSPAAEKAAILTGAIATQLGTYFGYVFPAVGLPTLPWPMYNGALAQGIKGPVWGDYFAAEKTGASKNAKEQDVAARIEALVVYLQSLQAK